MTAATCCACTTLLGVIEQAVGEFGTVQPSDWALIVEVRLPLVAPAHYELTLSVAAAAARNLFYSAPAPACATPAREQPSGAASSPGCARRSARGRSPRRAQGGRYPGR